MKILKFHCSYSDFWVHSPVTVHENTWPGHGPCLAETGENRSRKRFPGFPQKQQQILELSERNMILHIPLSKQSQIMPRYFPGPFRNCQFIENRLINQVVLGYKKSIFWLKCEGMGTEFLKAATVRLYGPPNFFRDCTRFGFWTQKCTIYHLFKTFFGSYFLKIFWTILFALNFWAEILAAPTNLVLESLHGQYLNLY